MRLIHSVLTSFLVRCGVAVTALSVLLTVLCLVALTNTGYASLIAYEPFSYSVGPINNGAATTATGIPTATTGGGFSGTWFAGGVGTTIVGGLTYSGLQTASNALQWSASVNYQGENLATPLFPATTPTQVAQAPFIQPNFNEQEYQFYRFLQPPPAEDG